MTHFSVQDGDVVLTGTNLRIVSGTGATNDNGELTGLGNLVIGYGQPSRQVETAGSHNLVVGTQHQYTSHSGILSGTNHTLHSVAGAIIGGRSNQATDAPYGVIIGGSNNAVHSNTSTIVGGYENTISGEEGHALVLGNPLSSWVVETGKRLNARLSLLVNKPLRFGPESLAKTESSQGDSCAMLQPQNAYIRVSIGSIGFRVIQAMGFSRHQSFSSNQSLFR
jgi:hypothetical protein